MVKRTLIKRIERTLKNAFVSCAHMDITVSYSIYRVNKRHRFLFWTWEEEDYEIERSIPYIREPFDDGDYSTNSQLRIIADMMEAGAQSIIQADRVSREEEG